MKISIATDHNGTEIKKEIIRFLKSRSHEVVDLSPSNGPLDNYPEFAFAVANNIVDGESELGILVCGTGIGMSIAANKVKGIRCAHVTNVNDAALARKHNNANIIAVGKNTPINDLLKIIDIFIATPFGKEERHKRRIDMITDYEENN